MCGVVSERPPPPDLSPDGRFYWADDQWRPYLAPAASEPTVQRRASVPPDWAAFADWFVWARRNLSQDPTRCLAAAAAAIEDRSGDVVVARRAAFDRDASEAVRGLDPALVRYALEIADLAGDQGDSSAIQSAMTAADPTSAAQALLAQTISQYIRAGFRVVSQTSTSAHLIRPKTFSLVWSLLWFLVFGIGLVVYVLYYVAKHDAVVTIQIDPAGRLSVTRS